MENGIGTPSAQKDMKEDKEAPLLRHSGRTPREGGVDYSLFSSRNF